MITDIHCHFIPDDLSSIVLAQKEFATKLISADGDRVEIDVRGMYFGLNRTFFEPARQIARMDALGIDRTVVSLATPLVNYYVESRAGGRGGPAVQRRARRARRRRPRTFRGLGFPAHAGSRRGGRRAPPLRARIRLHRRACRYQRAWNLSAGRPLSTDLRCRESSSTFHCSCIPPIRPDGTAPASTS